MDQWRCADITVTLKADEKKGPRALTPNSYLFIRGTNKFHECHCVILNELHRIAHPIWWLCLNGRRLNVRPVSDTGMICEQRSIRGHAHWVLAMRCDSGDLSKCWGSQRKKVLRWDRTLNWTVNLSYPLAIRAINRPSRF